MSATIRDVAISAIAAWLLASSAGAQPSALPEFTASALTQVTFAGGDAVKTTYRLRRAELKVAADLGKQAHAVVMVDAATALSLNASGATPTVAQSSRALQDAYISVSVRQTTIAAGRQQLPLGFEGAMSAGNLETVERALMASDKARFASFGDVRSGGIMVERSWSAIDYQLGMFNGSGETVNGVAWKAGKAVVGSVAVHPMILPWLRLGLSGATSGSGASNHPTRDRLGVDVQLVVGPVALQLEGMKGQDGPTRRLGRYALATYAATPRFTLVSRLDVWDPDLASDVYAATVGECDYVGGFTWLPAAARLKVQLNVVHKTYSVGLGPSSTQVLSQLQASW